MRPPVPSMDGKRFFVTGAASGIAEKILAGIEKNRPVVLTSADIGVASSLSPKPAVQIGVRP
jgi:short-subunit dehydrogenase